MVRFEVSNAFGIALLSEEMSYCDFMFDNLNTKLLGS